MSARIRRWATLPWWFGTCLAMCVVCLFCARDDCADAEPIFREEPVRVLSRSRSGTGAGTVRLEVRNGTSGLTEDWYCPWRYALGLRRGDLVRLDGKVVDGGTRRMVARRPKRVK